MSEDPFETLDYLGDLGAFGLFKPKPKVTKPMTPAQKAAFSKIDTAMKAKLKEVAKKVADKKVPTTTQPLNVVCADCGRTKENHKAMKHIFKPKTVAAPGWTKENQQFTQAQMPIVEAAAQKEDRQVETVYDENTGQYDVVTRPTEDAVAEEAQREAVETSTLQTMLQDPQAKLKAFWASRTPPERAAIVGVPLAAILIGVGLYYRGR